MTGLRLEQNGRVRDALVALPPRLAAPCPLLLVFHGAGATAELARANTGWGEVAPAAGMIAVFPEGTRRDPERPPAFRQNPQSWNDGSGRGHVARDGTDDVAFTRALIEEAAGRWPVDRRRIYATGFSNGASLAFRLATEASDQLAAVAPVAGHLWLEAPAPTRPVPLLLLSGGADPLNPVEGGTVRTPWGATEYHPPILESAQRWAVAVGCDPVPRELLERPGVRTLAWRGPDPRADVRATLIADLGHAWPGGRRLLPEWIGGPASDLVDGARTILDFLTSHHL